MRTTTIALLFVMLSSVTACDDFLATDPKGDLTSESFFTTPEHAIQATNATYSILRQWEVHVHSWVGQTDIASDDATKGSVPGDGPFIGELDELTFEADNLSFTHTWPGYYKGIYRANVAIEGIPRVPMDEQLKARLIGENKFLRAYFFFFLVRAYGGVPLLTAPLPYGEFQLPRATVAETYDLIEQDLRDAMADLPASYPLADLGRATKGAAQGMLAQVHLYQGEYGDALQHATAVIDSAWNSLFSDYRTLFTPAGESSSEAVFEVVAAVNPGSGCQPFQGCSNTQYAQTQGVRGIPNLGWGFNTPSPSLEAAYEPGDPRLQATILYPWELLPDGTDRVVYRNPAMPNNRYNQKVFISPETPGGSFNAGTNIRRLRYADVLLIAAEAAYQEGDEALARSYVNMIRERARGGRTLTLGFTPEALAQTIAVDVLGRSAADSRVFVRFVRDDTPAYAAGLRGFTYDCADGSCASADVPPVLVTSMDIIEAVDGTPVTTPAEYFAALENSSAGSSVVLTGVRIEQEVGAAPTSTPFGITITAQELLPDVTETGPALLDAIWHERRVELAMEQHRMFDLRRQDAVSPGRAAELMAVHGKTWEPRHALYPIPASEVQIAGLTQNPGY